MKILVINCGSSSLKYQLFNMDNEEVMAKGLVERIGIEGSRLVQEVGEEEWINETAIPDHNKAVHLVFEALTDTKHGVIKDMQEIDAVGHRVVHGGEKFTESTLVDDDVIAAIEQVIPFSPLHNPANLQGIKAAQEALPGKPNVAVFDTAFHQSMPKENYMYALPYELYTDHGIRRYGFHGTSHYFVTLRASELLNIPVDELNIISCHLGNGSSVTAVKNGKSYITSMGQTPLAGVPMGTRCGDIDPAIVTFMQTRLGKSAEEVDAIMNKQSGVAGVSGVSSDFRDLENASAEGNERAQLALDMFHARVRETVAGYAADLGRVDAITFTGGIGENGANDRAAICKGLEIMGVKLDKETNSQRKPKEKKISAEDSAIAVWVIPTNEELMIARDTMRLSK
ncbi:acetate kinase [Murdochiella massiliensis]|uniref:acetate kinase n=1 Tax=Murdochiella massiliensis TaxID=1673723 RepID=UPI00082B97FC|nr:acetate kinase [Murdochiella massiliensis]